jgi:S1-C subfamily serine protease
VPVVTLTRIANTLLKHGRVRRGYLGIGTQQVPVPPAIAQKSGLKQESALLIVTVEPGSPAEKGGLLIGDLLVSLADQPTTDGGTLRAQLGADRLGQTIAAKVFRGGEPREFSIAVGERA